VRLGTKTFYRKVQQVGKRSYPVKGPKIIAVNHRNGLSDAILLASLLQEQPTFLTRADVFLKPLARKALNWFKMIPVYRSRDGVDVIKMNQETFQFCINELKEQRSVFIFPEGNHARKHRVRPLKKGLARIAFQAAEQTHFKMPLQVVPVGITYTDYIKIGGQLLVWYGKPIDLRPYYSTYQENPRKALVEVTQAGREGLKALTLHISDIEHYDFIDNVLTLFIPDWVAATGRALRNPHHRLLAGQEIIRRTETNPSLLDQETPLQTYFQQLEALNLRDHVVRRGPFSRANRFLKGLGLFLLSPFFLFSALHHFWLYRWPYRFALKNFKDDQWYQSISMLFATFPALPYHLLLFFLAWALTDSLLWAGSYIVLVLGSGYLALQMIRWWKRWRGEVRYMRLLKHKDPVAGQLAPTRKMLVERIQAVMQAAGLEVASQGQLNTELGRHRGR